MGHSLGGNLDRVCAGCVNSGKGCIGSGHFLILVIAAAIAPYRPGRRWIDRRFPMYGQCGTGMGCNRQILCGNHGRCDEIRCQVSRKLGIVRSAECEGVGFPDCQTFYGNGMTGEILIGGFFSIGIAGNDPLFRILSLNGKGKDEGTILRAGDCGNIHNFRNGIRCKDLRSLTGKLVESGGLQLNLIQRIRAQIFKNSFALFQRTAHDLSVYVRAGNFQIRQIRRGLDGNCDMLLRSRNSHAVDGKQIVIPIKCIAAECNGCHQEKQEQRYEDAASSGTFFFRNLFWFWRCFYRCGLYRLR